VEGSCEHGIEPSGSIKCWEVFMGCTIGGFSRREIPRRCPGIYNLSFYNLRDRLLPSIYPWLRNRCLDINNSSLLVSADMSHVPVASQRSGWNIHSSSDISALWAECHISHCIHGKIVMPEHTHTHNTFTFI
jgi:hypothetical protein